MFKVVAIRMIAPNVHLLTLEAPEVAASARDDVVVVIVRVYESRGPNDEDAVTDEDGFFALNNGAL